MSISSLSSLATTAFDTARTTLKALADAAVPPPTTETPAGSAAMSQTADGKPNTGRPNAANRVTSAGPDPVQRDAEDPSVPANPRSRLGNVLDAYA